MHTALRLLRSVLHSGIAAEGGKAIANQLTAGKRVENGTSVGILRIAPAPYRRVVPILQPLVIVLNPYAVIGFHNWFLRSLRDGGCLFRDGQKRVACCQKNRNPDD